MFLPATPQELKTCNIHRPDIILVTGDAYIDSPFMGISLIGRVLESRGFSVGIIAQPDLKSGRDITRLGSPGSFGESRAGPWTPWWPIIPPLKNDASRTIIPPGDGTPSGRTGR